MIALAPVVLLAQLVSSHGSPSVQQPATAATSAGGLTWSVPRSWAAAASPSTMRVATYRVPAAPGDPEGGELAIFYFGAGQGGSVEGNVARWQSQLTPEGKAGAQPQPKKTNVGGVSVTLVTAEGTYSSGMPGASSEPKKGWALSGAIAEGPQGSVFFKLVGPKKTVAKAAADFDGLVKSLKRS